MNHQQVRPLLDQFLDCELEPASRWVVAAHLAECETCAAYLAEQASLRGLVRDRLAPVNAPAAVVARVRESLRAADPPVVQPAAQPAWRLAWQPALVAGLAALLLLAALVGAWLRRDPAVESQPVLAAELIAQHSLFARDESLLDVAGDGATVGGWFRARLGYTPATPNLDGFELKGGRLGVVDGRPAAQLVYENEAGDVYLSLLSFDDDASPGGGDTGANGVAVIEQATEAVVVWSVDGRGTALIAPLPSAELLRLAAAIRSQT